MLHSRAEKISRTYPCHFEHFEHAHSSSLHCRDPRVLLVWQIDKFLCTITLSWYPEKRRVVSRLMESAARPARVLLRSSILLTVYPGNLPRHTKDGRLVYARCRGEGRRGEDAFSWSARLGAAKRETRCNANPVSTRVCTPRYYDTQQAGVYSTPSKNTLGARRSARSGVLRVARGRLRAVRAAFKKSRGFRSSRRAIGRTTVHGSACTTVPIRTRCGERFDVRPPRSRPCQWLHPGHSRSHALDNSRRARGGLREEPSRTPRRGIFPRSHRPSDTFRGIPSGTTRARGLRWWSRWNLARRKTEASDSCMRAVPQPGIEQVSRMFRVTVTRERTVSDGRVIKILRRTS